MLAAIGLLARRATEHSRPWSNVYGLARSMLATSTALTLMFSHSTSLFRPGTGLEGEVPVCTGIRQLGTFCLASPHLEIGRWLAVGLLLLVASGWRPRITGIIHWWVSLSLFSSAVVVDGGDQVSAVLALLMLPLTLTDPRRSHWDKMPAVTNETARVIARWTLALIRLQVAGIYFHAAAGKFAVEEWADGTALYYWLLHPGLGAPNWLAPIIRPLLLNGTAVSLLTWSIIVLEFLLCMGLVVPKPQRKWLLGLGIALHVGIMLIHGLISFGLAMCAALILFLRPVEQEFDFSKGVRWARAILARYRRRGHVSASRELASN